MEDKINTRGQGFQQKKEKEDRNNPGKSKWEEDWSRNRKSKKKTGKTFRENSCTRPRISARGEWEDQNSSGTKNNCRNMRNKMGRNMKCKEKRKKLENQYGRENRYTRRRISTRREKEDGTNPGTTKWKQLHNREEQKGRNRNSNERQKEIKTNMKEKTVNSTPTLHRKWKAQGLRRRKWIFHSQLPLNSLH